MDLLLLLLLAGAQATPWRTASMSAPPSRPGSLGPAWPDVPGDAPAESERTPQKRSLRRNEDERRRLLLVNLSGGR